MPTFRPGLGVGRASKAIEDFCKASLPRQDRGRLSPTTRTSPTSAPTSPASGIDVDKVDVMVDVPTSVGRARRQQRSPRRRTRSSCLRRRLVRPDRQGLHAQHHSLDLRHLGARQRHRQRHRQDRRRHLVLPHRRLCLRPRARARHRRGREKNGGKVLGKVRHPSRRRTSPPSCCRRSSPRPRSSASPTPAPTPSTPSSRPPSSASSQGGQNLAGLLVFITDVHALGLKTAQGLIFTEAWYWDLNDANRAFAKAFAPANKATCRPWCRPASTRPSSTT